MENEGNSVFSFISPDLGLFLELWNQAGNHILNQPGLSAGRLSAGGDIERFLLPKGTGLGESPANNSYSRKEGNKSSKKLVKSIFLQKLPYVWFINTERRFLLKENAVAFL